MTIDWDRARPGLTRQELLKSAGLGGLVLGAGGLLGCGGGSSPKPSSSTVGGRAPKRGGTLRVGLTGGGSGDSLNPLNSITVVDQARSYQLFDELVSFDSSLIPRLKLAQEISPNSDGTVWTIRLRPDVTFHNGKQLTADDVIYTFQQILNPKSPGAGASGIQSVDAGQLKKLDKLTVRVPCKAPFATFVETLPTYNYRIIPVGFDAKHPIGTGPFKFKSFSPGQQSTFVRNANYWQAGLPYVDEIVISDYNDETSMLNALAARQLDLVAPLTSDSVQSVQSAGGNVRIYATAMYTPFTMRVDQSPFNDVRVRQAMRLIVNRKQMIDLVFGGHGTIGNDIFAIADPVYDHHIPQRDQDLEMARSLLKQAGQENLTVELVTSPIAQGTTKAAQVLAQQATGAGVTVRLRQVTATEQFGPNYLKWTFAQDYYTYGPYLPQAGVSTIPTAPFNETHFGDPRYVKLYEQGTATVDSAKRAAVAREMQMIDHSKGGYIIPYFSPGIDGLSDKIGGAPVVKRGTGFPFNTFDFKSVWLA